MESRGNNSPLKTRPESKAMEQHQKDPQMNVKELLLLLVVWTYKKILWFEISMYNGSGM